MNAGRTFRLKGPIQIASEPLSARRVMRAESRLALDRCLDRSLLPCLMRWMDHRIKTRSNDDMLDVRTVSTQELQQGMDRDNGLHLLNVQTDRFFTGEFIPGSRRIPLDEIEQATRHLPKDADIVTYCAGPGCSQSAEAAYRLRGLGFANVRAYREGLEGWRAAGNEIVVSQRAPAA